MKSETLREYYLDWRFALGPFAAAHAFKDESTTTLHDVSLWRGHPEDGGVEVAAGDYARQAAGWGAANWTRTTNTVVNDNDITFTLSAAADWAALGDEVTHVVMMGDGSEILDVSELAVARLIVTGDPVIIPAGTLEFVEI